MLGKLEYFYGEDGDHFVLVAIANKGQPNEQRAQITFEETRAMTDKSVLAEGRRTLAKHFRDNEQQT